MRLPDGIRLREVTEPAEDEHGEVVSAGWLRALVAHRTRVAVERGFRYLHVDASPDSAPILFTPDVFTPA